MNQPLHTNGHGVEIGGIWWGGVVSVSGEARVGRGQFLFFKSDAGDTVPERNADEENHRMSADVRWSIDSDEAHEQARRLVDWAESGTAASEPPAEMMAIPVLCGEPHGFMGVGHRVRSGGASGVSASPGRAGQKRTAE